MIQKTNRPRINRHPATKLAGGWFSPGLLFVLLALTGCQSIGPSSCSTPEVTGRVLAADTQQPLAGVKVIRVMPGQSAATSTPVCGAQLLQQGQPEMTGADGRFVVPGRQYVTLFRHASWWSVRLAFQAPGYALFQTNFSTADITNQPDDGAPAVNAGDIVLKPKTK